ncbi:MAG TPA: hypothetical protein DCY89_05140 [Gammaproteobacteria bacterium]|nr:hypothetical protein [Gammaproteobacteria bacterium]
MSSRSISLSDGGPFWGKVSTGTLWGKIAVGALAGACAGAAQAAPVTISGISSSEPNLFTGATLNAAGNQVVIEFADFSASAPKPMGPISQPFASAFDTISFRLTASEGWFFTTLDYIEGLQGTATNGGFAFGTGSFTYNGTSVTLGTFPVFSNGGSGVSVGSLFTSPTIQLGPQFTTLDITITNSLFAGALGANATATIAKTSALLNIQTQFIPVPAAAWLFASAMVGLVTIGRRGSFS